MTDTKPAPTFSLRNDYKEPTSVLEYRKQIDIHFWNAAGDTKRFVNSLVDRIAALEAALLPFAVAGMNMAQARLMLNAKGMQTTPAGGTWISTLNNISVTAADAIFYDAIDALGHVHVNSHMQEQFAAMQRVMKASDERDDHVDAGGATH